MERDEKKNQLTFNELLIDAKWIAMDYFFSLSLLFASKL